MTVLFILVGILLAIPVAMAIAMLLVALSPILIMVATLVGVAYILTGWFLAILAFIFGEIEFGATLLILWILLLLLL